jgi:hypothetical protein
MAKTLSFTDERVKGGNRIDRPDVFKAEEGKAIRIRFLTLPMVYGAAQVNIMVESSRKGMEGQMVETGFKAPSRCPSDLIERVLLDRDRDARGEAEKLCPLFARGYKVKARFPVLVHVISEQGKRGKAKERGDFLVWDMPGQTFEQLREACRALPKKKGTDEPVDVRAIEWIVSCSDEQFQKVTLNAIYTSADMESSYKADVAAANAAEVGEAGWHKDPELVYDIRDLIEPEDDLEDSLDRAEKSYEKDGVDVTGDDVDDDPDLDEKPATKKKGRTPKKKAAPKEADSDLADEIDGIMGDDDEADEPDDAGDDLDDLDI